MIHYVNGAQFSFCLMLDPTFWVMIVKEFNPFFFERHGYYKCEKLASVFFKLFSPSPYKFQTNLYIKKIIIIKKNSPGGGDRPACLLQVMGGKDGNLMFSPSVT